MFALNFFKGLFLILAVPKKEILKSDYIKVEKMVTLHNIL